MDHPRGSEPARVTYLDPRSQRSEQAAKRQQAVQEVLIEAAEGEEGKRPVACVCILATEDGTIKTRIVNIEPEQVGQMLESLDRAKARMQTFLGGAPEAPKPAPISNIRRTG